MKWLLINTFRNRSQTAGMQRIHPQSESLVRDVQAELNRQGNERRSRRLPQDQCPICLGEVSFGVETNCGHIYCGLCILTYWQHGSWGEVGAMKCAVCRQQVCFVSRVSFAYARGIVFTDLFQFVGM